MVATPELIGAKAALAASLRRGDPNPRTKANVEEFTQLLDNTVDECSRPNVQKCKNWILANVLQSRGRTATLGSLLVAFAESMDVDFDRPSVRRRRLAVLYVVSDVLHHAVARQRNDWIAGAWHGHLHSLVATASSFEKCPKHLKRVRDLISLWEERRYLPDATIQQLRDAFTLSSDRNSGTRIHISDEALKNAKGAPYTMPSRHGDPTAAWTKLPPACWLAELAPNSIVPLRRTSMRPAKLSKGPADAALVDAVKAALSDREQLYQKENLQAKVGSEVSQLGEEKRPGSVAQECADDDTYWGWTRSLCGRAKERKKDGQGLRTQSTLQLQQPRLRVRSPPSRASRSRSPRSSKRRKFSARSRSASRSRSGSRSRSRSRTPSRSRRRDSSDSRSYSPPARRGRPERRRSQSRSWTSRSRSRSRSRTRSRPRRHSPDSYRHSGSRAPHQPPPAPRNVPAMPHQGLGTFPIPPPPPPPPIGYQGTYQGNFPPPPPPPPPPPQSWVPNQPGFGPPHMMGGGWSAGSVPPPPPPPPPPPYGGHQQFNSNNWAPGPGRGGGGSRGYRGRGRGNSWSGGNSYGGGRGYGGNS